VVKHTSRDDDPQRSLCGRNMVPGFTVGNAANCKLCEAIESKRQRTAELTRDEVSVLAQQSNPAFAEHLLTESQPETPVPSPVFQVQGRRGGGWYNVPRDNYYSVSAAIQRVGVLAGLVEDSEFRVLNTATGEVAHQRLKRAVPSPVGWPGAGMVSGRADYAREPKRYRRCKGTRHNRRQCRGGWGK